MATLMCSGTVMLVKTRHGMEATTYDDEIEAVEDMLNNGSLGGGSYHGCEQHVVALARVANRINEIRAEMEARAARELADEVEV